MRFNEGISAAGTGADHCKIGSSEVMPHAYLAGSNIKDHFRNKKRIEAGRAIAFCKFGDLILKSDQSTNTAGKNNTDPVRIDIILIQTGLAHGLVTRH